MISKEIDLVRIKKEDLTAQIFLEGKMGLTHRARLTLRIGSLEMEESLNTVSMIHTSL